MQEILSAIPSWTFSADILVCAVIILVCFLTHREVRNTSLHPVGQGLTIWALVHEGYEMVYLFFLMVSSSLFYPAFQIFGRGACVIGPAAVLIGVAYVYAKKRGADFEEMRDAIILGFGFLVVGINALWATLPAVALGITFYTPVVLAFILSAILLYRAGVHSNWITGLLAMGLGHELFEAVLFHGMAIKLLRGADPAAVSEPVFLVFLCLQVAGPIILWYQSRKE